MNLARRPNYGFQKQQKDLKKQKKREEKDAKKQAKREAEGGAPLPTDTPENENG